MNNYQEELKLNYMHALILALLFKDMIIDGILLDVIIMVIIVIKNKNIYNLLILLITWMQS